MYTTSFKCLVTCTCSLYLKAASSNISVTFSDVHIRAGIDTLDPKITRFDEYSAVFNRIYHFFASWRAAKRDDLVIVITGDLLHDKRKAGATCINLVHSFIKNLADIAPVYIIRGNHDYDQASRTQHDMISSYMGGFSDNILLSSGVQFAS